jgi:hypothetical protein
MNVRMKSSLAAVVCAISITDVGAYAAGTGSGKAKGKQAVGAKGNHGREVGELPYGLEQYSTKKGELPSGLHKKANDEFLTRGLEEGGKKPKTTAHSKKGHK